MNARKQLAKVIDLDSLPKNKARVEIAKDVIAGLEVGKLRATNGTYFTLPDMDYQRDLRDQIGETAVPCSVCALGAMFVADVARRNNHKGGMGTPNGPDSRDGFDRLKDFFLETEINLIERVFEWDWDRYGFPEDATDCMRAIMQNIIDNDGEFKP